MSEQPNGHVTKILNNLLERHPKHFERYKERREKIVEGFFVIEAYRALSKQGFRVSPAKIKENFLNLLEEKNGL